MYEKETERLIEAISDLSITLQDFETDLWMGQTAALCPIQVKVLDNRTRLYSVCGGTYSTPYLERAAVFCRYIAGGTVSDDDWGTIKADIISQRLDERKRKTKQSE